MSSATEVGRRWPAALVQRLACRRPASRHRRCADPAAAPAPPCPGRRRTIRRRRGRWSGASASISGRSSPGLRRRGLPDSAPERASSMSGEGQRIEADPAARADSRSGPAAARCPAARGAAPGPSRRRSACPSASGPTSACIPAGSRWPDRARRDGDRDGPRGRRCPCTGRLQILDQAEDGGGIAVGPAADREHRAFDRAVVLADRAMLPEGVAALMLQPERRKGTAALPAAPAIARASPAPPSRDRAAEPA